MYLKRPRFPQWTLTVLLLGTLTAGSGALRAASAQDAATVGDFPTRRAERIQMLREEFKERQKEVREALESARHAKHAHGRKVEQVLPDNDLLPANLRAGHVALPAGISQANIAPTNVKANNKTGDAANAGQAEQSLAFVGQYGLCAWNDGQGFNLTPQDVQGYGYTINGGATWTDGGIPPKAGTIATWTSDPSVSVNEKTGEFYYVGLTSNTGTNNNGLAVARGHFTGATFLWDGVSVVSSGPSASQGFDKEWVCADSLTGNVYTTWTLFTTTGDNVFTSRSLDGGVTWGAPIQVNGSWENGLVSGSRPVVGPNGEVYVVYNALGAVDADSMKIAKSVNFGASYAPAVVGGTDMDNYFTGAPGFNRGRAVTFPGVAVDRSTGPFRGRVYMTWHDAVNFYGDALSSTAAANSKTEVENNGNFANATLFAPGQTLRGNITGTTDLDVWKFPAVQGTTYIFFVDSLRGSTFRYVMRLYCPNDTTVLSRLANSSDGNVASDHALIVWTCPATNTYYLRMTPVAANGGYRIRTGIHTAVPSDHGRDARDISVVASANGVTGWSAIVRPNDDVAYLDDWLPEVAVPCDGKAYVMWFDWRDTPSDCFGGSNIYLSRSTDGGATWAPNQVATTAVTANWTQVLSNIAPNQGDYNGIYGGDALGLAFADGRLGDADVFVARLATDYSLGACPTAQVVTPGSPFNGSVQVTNNNPMFANTYTYSVTVDRNWPGYPATGSIGVGSLASNSIPFSISVPDSARHNEVVNVCITVSLNGACVSSCCFQVTVNNIVTGTLGSLASSTAAPGRVQMAWYVDNRATINAYRSLNGNDWTSIGSYVPGGDGLVTITDTAVQPGVRYAYRIGMVQAGREVMSGTSWVQVPMSASFALGRAFPSPAKAGFTVSFSLPSDAPATLEVLDLFGRRVVSRSVGSLGAGSHTLSLEDEALHLPAGMYAIRLTQGHNVATGKVSLIR